jgi:vacuolar protein sorting-associated protein 41
LSPTLLNIPSTITPETKVLLEIAVDLLLLSKSRCFKSKQFASCLIYGLHLRKPRQLDLVTTYNLFECLKEHCLLVMQYDSDIVASMKTIPPPPEGMSIDLQNDKPNRQTDIGRALVGAQGVQLLVNYCDVLPVFTSNDQTAFVVQKLTSHPRFLHIYLDALWVKNTNDGTEFHNLQMALYAEYDPARLLQFLKRSIHYSVPDAYDICEKRDLVHEMMYLLGKLGNKQKALYLIIDRLNDVEMVC